MVEFSCTYCWVTNLNLIAMAVRKVELDEVEEADKVLDSIKQEGPYKVGNYGFTDDIVRGYLLMNNYVKKKKSGVYVLTDKGKFVVKNGGIGKADPKAYYLQRRRRKYLQKKLAMVKDIILSKRVGDIIVGVIIGLILAYILN